jgi:hypothetical protein
MQRGVGMGTLAMLLLISFITACGVEKLLYPLPDLIEAEPDAVVACRQLGAITEMAEPDRIGQWWEARRIKKRVMQRALAMGATHIVWDVETPQMAGAIAYHCPP